MHKRSSLVFRFLKYFYEFLLKLSMFGMRYLRLGEEKLSYKKVFALQYSPILSFSISFVDFKLRWKRSDKKLHFCIFGFLDFLHFQLIFGTKYFQDTMSYALTIKKFLLFNACFLRISKGLVRFLLQASS